MGQNDLVKTLRMNYLFDFIKVCLQINRKIISNYFIYKIIL